MAIPPLKSKATGHEALHISVSVGISFSTTNDFTGGTGDGIQRPLNALLMVSVDGNSGFWYQSEGSHQLYHRLATYRRTKGFVFSSTPSCARPDSVKSFLCTHMKQVI